MGMNWLITGGCGFIGTRLVKDLVSEGGHFIRIIDNLSVGTRENLARICDFVELDLDTFNSRSPVINLESSQSSKVELIVGDIFDEHLALKAAEGIEVIVHLAASTGVEQSVANPRLDCLTNVTGTLNYVEAARHNSVKRFIFASSSAPIGECEPPIHEELAPHPVSPYGASKLAGEAYCSAYFHTFGIETVALRFGNVYGPGSNHKNSVVAKFIRQAMSDETLEIYGDGEQTRDFIYIDDLINAIRLAVSMDQIGGEVFQIATNAETTVNNLVDMLLSILEEHGIDEAKIKHAGPRQGDVRRNFSDISKARSKLGWQPRVPLEDGLQRTVSWFVENQSAVSF
jgi:UDP-glucose 4-epimerase